MLPTSTEDAHDNWKKALAAYTQGSEPPIKYDSREDFDTLVTYMQKSVAYHDAKAMPGSVLRYCVERYPCAMGDTILTDRDRMREDFGISAPYYRTLLAQEGPPPLVAGVLTYSPLRIGPDESFVDGYVFHMIGPDLLTYIDGSPTADLRELLCVVGDPTDQCRLFYAAAVMHARIWYICFKAAHDHGLTKVEDVLVGGGSFVPEEWHDSFKTRVHDTALYLLGYGTDKFHFPGVELVPPPRVPKQVVHDPKMLHVNAWCHSSFVGNGNAQDCTLDGAWGCLGPMAPLAWPLTNPWLQLRSVEVPEFPAQRPQDRACGKPPMYDTRSDPQRVRRSA